MPPTFQIVLSTRYGKVHPHPGILKMWESGKDGFPVPQDWTVKGETERVCVRGILDEGGE